MPDPDPYQNVTDPEHWVRLVVQIVLVVGRASGRVVQVDGISFILCCLVADRYR